MKNIGSPALPPDKNIFCKLSMNEKKDSVLIASSFISCNQVCASMKERGLPFDSIWLLIGHTIKNIDKISCLDDDQKQVIREAFDAHLPSIKTIGKAEVERHGAEFLTEIERLKGSATAKSLKTEQEFNAKLLNAISKNLSQLYNIINKSCSGSRVESLKTKTLESIKSARNRDEVLKIVEASFDNVNNMLQTTRDNMDLSMESLLLLESNTVIDSLTSIFNRRFFDRELPNVVQSFLEKKGAVPFSLLLIDIDKFKEINDIHGHLIGDHILQRVAAVIQNNCRGGIDSPIRWGGDEFALFLIGTNEKNAAKKAETIRTEICNKPMTFTQAEGDQTSAGKPLSVEVSIGVCELDISWKDVETSKLKMSAIFHDPSEEKNPISMLTCKLIESADQALYEAKAKGRNQVCVYHKKP
jgi:diguanylate cyclase (GGDEF)-like protein